MGIDNLSLDQIYELEAANPPMAGSRTNVFLEADERPGPTFSKPLQNLTERELLVLQMIGAGLMSGEIAIRLHVGVKAIESCRESLKRKLQVKFDQVTSDVSSVVLKEEPPRRSERKS